MRTRQSLLFSFVFILSIGLAAAQSPRVHITQTIDDRNTVILPGNVHPVAAASNSFQPVDDETPLRRMILYLKADTGQETQLEQLIGQLNDPKSPNYHQYLTPAGFASQFGAATTDIAKVTSWLELHGFTIDEVTAGARSIIFSGTAGQVSSAFNTEIRRYNIAGASYIANASNPQIPAALAAAVGGIVKLHNFRHGHSLTSPKAVSAAELAHPQFTTGSNHYVSPADYGTIYDINPLYSGGINGTGQAIAVVARSNIAMSDVTNFRNYFGLKANNPQFVLTNGDPGVLPGDSTETTLDTEWSGAVAPSATIKVIMSASTSTADGIDLAATYAVNNNVAPIITLSYGTCEAAMGSSELAFYNSLWKQAAAQGQTVFVAAGDSGAAGCDYSTNAHDGQAVNGLCSSPSTCVGGTEFVEGNNPGQYWLPGNNSTYGSAVSYIPESVWNESGTVSGGSDLWAGGGGASMIYPKPGWQSGPGVPGDGKRDVPDVSLTAAGHDGYLIWLDGALNSVGGTSAATPSFAGLMALIDQKMNAKQGLINPILYPIAARQASGGPAVFHDIVAGNNSVPGQVGFSATTGFDPASGLGSVDANVLANNWGNQSNAPTLTLSACSSSVNLQPSRTGTVTITSAATSLNAPVTLSVSGAPSGLTATLASSTIAAPGSGSFALNLTAAASLAIGTYPVTVKAVSGTQTATVIVPVVVTAPIFTISPATVALTAMAGGNAQTTLTITPQNGFTAAVNFSAASVPNGISASFSSNAASANAVFALAKTMNAGTYVFNVAATGGGVTKTVAVSLTVTAQPACTLVTNPAALSLTAGKAASIALSCSVTKGTFATPLAVVVSGVPAGMTAQVANNALTPGSTSTLSITTTPGMAAAQDHLSIAVSGSGYTQTISLPVTIMAASFTLGNSPSLSINAGASGPLSITVQHYGSFNAAIAISVAGLPAGVTAAFSKSSLPAPGDGTDVVTFSVASTVKAGAYPITINATGGSATQTSSVNLMVNATPSFTLSVSASSVTIPSGGSGTLTTSTGNYNNGFNGQLAMTYNGLPYGVNYGVTGANASNNMVNITVTFYVSTSVAPGTYPITIKDVGNSGNSATGSGVVEAATFNLVVTAPASAVKH